VSGGRCRGGPSQSLQGRNKLAEVMIDPSTLWCHRRSDAGDRPPPPRQRYAKVGEPTPSACSNRVKYRPDVDGLRAIAILSVVGFHFFPTTVRGGFIGVDIFFVISGFLISNIIFESIDRNEFSFWNFYSRRIRRIFPALLTVLAANFLLGWFLLLPEEYAQLGKHIAGGAAFVSNFVLWDESGYFSSAAETKPLLHLWSLGIEEQFYIFYPLLIWLSWKLRLSLIAITTIVAAGSFALTVSTLTSDPVATFYAPQTRFWELTVGSMLAHAMLCRHKVTYTDAARLTKYRRLFKQLGVIRGMALSNMLSIFGAVLLCGGLILITQETPFPGFWALLPTIGTALIISAGQGAWINRRVLSSPPLVWVGLISFPLYLWHWTLLSFARIAEGKDPGLEIKLWSIVSCIALSWLSYKVIEQNLRFGELQRLKTNVLLCLMVVVCFVGHYTFAHKGLSFRFPTMQELSQFDFDYRPVYREGTCFLRPEQDYRSFALCEQRESSKGKAVLWGDSHAAHLYPGYRKHFSVEYEVVQRTASSCPPIVGKTFGNRPHCEQINDYVMKEIGEIVPDRVVLAAIWHAYDWKEIRITIDRLKSVGVKNIDLIGPVPLWNNPLPRQLYLYSKADSLHRVPGRMSVGLNRVFLATDRELSELAISHQVNYFSPAKILCNDSGCITKLEDSVNTIVAWDYGHLTIMGSDYLVSNFRADISRLLASFEP
jgi:peptidoglycan/LPS O-acetylase OafA/YrhL